MIVRYIFQPNRQIDKLRYATVIQEGKHHQMWTHLHRTNRMLQIVMLQIVKPSQIAFCVIK